MQLLRNQGHPPIAGDIEEEIRIIPIQTMGGVILEDEVIRAGEDNQTSSWKSKSKQISIRYQGWLNTIDYIFSKMLFLKFLFSKFVF